MLSEWKSYTIPMWFIIRFGQVFNAKLYISSWQYTSIFIQCLRISDYQVLITIIINVVVEYFLITMVLNYIVGQIILHESV